MPALSDAIIRVASRNVGKISINTRARDLEQTSKGDQKSGEQSEDQLVVPYEMQSSPIATQNNLQLPMTQSGYRMAEYDGISRPMELYKPVSKVDIVNISPQDKRSILIPQHPPKDSEDGDGDELL